MLDLAVLGLGTMATKDSGVSLTKRQRNLLRKKRRQLVPENAPQSYCSNSPLSLCISEGSDLHSGLPFITPSDIESDSCSSVSSGGPVGKVFNMGHSQARQCLDIVHDAVCLLSKSRRTRIKIDDLCAFVCSFFKLSAGDVMNAINA